jgi:hypothetical protein
MQSGYETQKRSREVSASGTALERFAFGRVLILPNFDSIGRVNDNGDGRIESSPLNRIVDLDLPASNSYGHNHMKLTPEHTLSDHEVQVFDPHTSYLSALNVGHYMMRNENAWDSLDISI